LGVRNDQDCARRAGIVIEIRHARRARKLAAAPACIARSALINDCFGPAVRRIVQYFPPHGAVQNLTESHRFP
jgi:hypothetical protein